MRDIGLAAERTRLSWERTALSGIGLAALLTRFGGDHHVAPIADLSAALALLLSAALMAWARACAGPVGHQARHTAMRCVAAATVALCATSALTIVFGLT